MSDATPSVCPTTCPKCGAAFVRSKTCGWMLEESWNVYECGTEAAYGKSRQSEGCQLRVAEARIKELEGKLEAVKTFAGKIRNPRKWQGDTVFVRNEIADELDSILAIIRRANMPDIPSTEEPATVEYWLGVAKKSGDIQDLHQAFNHVRNWGHALRSRLEEIRKGCEADEADLKQMRDGTKLTRSGLVTLLVFQQQDIAELKDLLVSLRGDISTAQAEIEGLRRERDELKEDLSMVRIIKFCEKENSKAYEDEVKRAMKLETLLRRSVVYISAHIVGQSIAIESAQEDSEDGEDFTEEIADVNEAKHLLAEVESTIGEREFHCIACGKISTTCPEGDEKCSHEWEPVRYEE